MANCAVGAQIRVVDNVDQQCGFVNGASGTITNVKTCRGYVTEVEVECDGNRRFLGQLTPQKEFVDERYLRWWPIPVVLNYAGSVHAYQGESMNFPHILDIRSAFVHGLAYTGLTRTTDPSRPALIYLARPLRATDLVVANLNDFYKWLDAHVKSCSNEDLDDTPWE